MKIFTKTSMMIVPALAIGIASASAAPFKSGRVDMTKFMYHVDSKSVFGNKRSKNIAKINEMMFHSEKSSPTKVAAQDGSFSPDVTFGPTHAIGDLDGPNGERWYYTGSFEYHDIPPHDDVAFTDHIMVSYRYDIYDPSMNLVGTIKNDINYADDEVRIASCELAPVICRHFFNTDDNYEVMVSLAINTTAQGYNRYRTDVFALGGETVNGNPKSLMHFDSLLGDVVEGPATADGKDNFFMTFASDYYGDGELQDSPAKTTDESDDDLDFGYEGFWEAMTSARMDLTIYSSATDGAGPRKLLEKSIKIANLPGDQESAPFILSFVHDNDVYFVFESLAEPLWNRYDNPLQEDITMRDPNTLNVEFYKVNGNSIDHQYTTSIAVTKDDTDGAIATFYSVGNLKYTGDINFDDYGTPAGRAALIVTKENYLPSADTTVPSYFIYDHNGKQLFTLGEYCDGTLTVSDLPGEDPIHVFIYNEGYYYSYSFVNLKTGEEELFLFSEFDIDDDTETLMANLDRVPAGNSYMYAIELKAPLLRPNGDNIMRILWLDKNGRFDHIDGINMGQNVQYAAPYIERDALSPTAFCSDDKREYLILIKRGLATDNLAEELIVGQVTEEDWTGGKQLLYAVPDDVRGVLSGIIPDFTGEIPTLSIYYSITPENQNPLYTQELYYLPLDGGNSGIDAVISDNNNSITVNGSVVTAEGDINVYSTMGVLVASGNGSVDLNSLSRGIYVIATKDATSKLLIK